MGPPPEDSEIELHNKALEFKDSGNEKFIHKNFKGAIIDYKKGKVFIFSSHISLSL